MSRLYKRYLEPNNENPLTNYMAKKVKNETFNRIVRTVSRKTADSDSDQDQGNVNETESTDRIESETLNQEDNHEVTDGDNEDFFRAISDQLIHPNLICKTADAITMILAFFLQHHLTWVALEDLLKLFHNVLGDNSNLPRTKYFFKKFFGPNQRTTIHFYCKKCMVYINTYDNLKSLQITDNKNPDYCAVCETEYSLKKLNDGHFFMELPLREQLEKRISEDIGILNYSTISDNSSAITDVFDGKLYKSLRAKVGPGPLVTLTFNTDGVRVFKSKRKASLWPIQWIINEVSPHKRLKQENIILSGIWFGTDPSFELYLKPFINEMNDLDERKIVIRTDNTEKMVTVRVLLFTADLPAKSKVLKFKQFNGEFGCSYCIHPGFMVGSSTSSKYTNEDFPLRTHSGTMNLIGMFLSTGQSSFGITGVSPLVGFKDFNLIDGTVIDYLHCVLEGVTYLLLNLWFDSNNHREKYYITPREMEAVNKNLKRITPIKSFSIKPRSIEEREYWKAHELKYWLLYYAVPCLSGVLKPTYLNHLALLSEAIFKLLKSEITTTDYEKATKYLNKFVDDFQKIYGEEHMVHNVHLLNHLPKCVQNCGPLWAYSNFNFESNNGSLVKHVHGTTDVEHQIASKYAFNNSLNRLKSLCESTSSTFHYIDRMKSMRVQKSEKIGKNEIKNFKLTILNGSTPDKGPITLFGSPLKHKLDAVEKSILQGSLEHIMAYNKLFYGNDIFVSATYKRAEQTNDTVVILKDQRIGIITLIFKETDSVFVLLKILETERVPNFPTHIKRIRKNNVNCFVKILAEEILHKLLIISTEKEIFITSLPNQYEGD